MPTDPTMLPAFLPALPEILLAIGALVLLMIGAFGGAADDVAGHRPCRSRLIVLAGLVLIFVCGRAARPSTAPSSSIPSPG